MRIKTTILAVAGCLALVQAGNAAQITGDLTFVPITDGTTYLPSAGPLSSATSVTVVSPEYVTAFAGFGGLVGTFDAVTINPTMLHLFNGAITHPNTWLTFDGFTFVATSVIYSSTPATDEIGIKVTGTLSGNSYGATPATVNATFTQTGSAIGTAFTLSTNPVPEAASLLVGFAPLALLAASRFIKRK